MKVKKDSAIRFLICTNTLALGVIGIMILILIN